MKAIRVHAYGQPPRLDDVPEPQATGPDDVIVRIGGAGLCRTDLHIIDGWFADVIPADLPVVLGHENAGWVHAVGPAVEHLAVGDPVICHPNLTCGVCRACRAGDDMRCARGPNLPGLMCAGGMAELFKTSARAVVKLPAGAEPAQVAALADAGLSAYHAVKKAVPALGPGSSAVAVGAGGLGHVGIQCLKAMTPAQVIAVDTSEDALKLARHCGADHTVTADGHQAQQVRDLTSTGADAVFDFVGEDPTIGDSIAMLRPGGTYYLVGYGGTVTLPTIQLVLGEITVAGNLIGTNPDLADLVTLTSQGRVTLHSTSYPPGRRQRRHRRPSPRPDPRPGHPHSPLSRPGPPGPQFPVVPAAACSAAAQAGGRLANLRSSASRMPGGRPSWPALSSHDTCCTKNGLPPVRRCTSPAMLAARAVPTTPATSRVTASTSSPDSGSTVVPAARFRQRRARIRINVDACNSVSIGTPRHAHRGSPPPC
jgi:NAD+-dependent secondary alcohol dehydrogenase Adh1